MVIVGAGTAGLIIANKLQENFDVTVIDKSKYKAYPYFYKIPLFIGLLFRQKNQKYIKKRDILMLNGRKIPFFESKVIGGASVINGCVHSFGSRLQWEPMLQKYNFTYSELLESYNQLFSFEKKEKNKINLSYSHLNEIDEAFIRALNKKNIPKGDMVSSETEGCGRLVNTVKKILRSSVLSVIDVSLFQIQTGLVANKILFDDDGKTIGIKTNKATIKSDYVILAAGVIGTCKVLQKTAAKSERKISKVINDLNIGAGIQDHTNLRINVTTKNNIGSLNEISKNFLKKLSLLVKHLLGKPTVMKGTGATSAAHLDLNNDGVIDTRIQLLQFSESGRLGSSGAYFSAEPGFSISITPISPKSKGQIQIDGSDIEIDPKYLSHRKDIEHLKIGLDYCLKLLNSEYLNKYILRIEQEDLIRNNPEKYIIDNIYSGYHLIGGSSDAINCDFKVHNLDGLFICDGSALNTFTASNIHSSVILTADVFANKFIKNNA